MKYKRGDYVRIDTESLVINATIESTAEYCAELSIDPDKIYQVEDANSIRGLVFLNNQHHVYEDRLKPYIQAIHYTRRSMQELQLSSTSNSPRH